MKIMIYMLHIYIYPGLLHILQTFTFSPVLSKRVFNQPRPAPRNPCASTELRPVAAAGHGHSRICAGHLCGCPETCGAWGVLEHTDWMFSTTCFFDEIKGHFCPLLKATKTLLVMWRKRNTNMEILVKVWKSVCWAYFEEQSIGLYFSCCFFWENWVWPRIGLIFWSTDLTGFVQQIFATAMVLQSPRCHLHVIFISTGNRAIQLINAGNT